MQKFNLILSALLCLNAGVLPTVQASITKKDEEVVNRLIGEYLDNNPEKVVNAIIKFQEQKKNSHNKKLSKLP